jgi:hypothetical protein
MDQSPAIPVQLAWPGPGAYLNLISADIQDFH